MQHLTCRTPHVHFQKGSSAGNGHVRAIPDLPRLLLQQDAKLQEAVIRLQQAIYQLYSAPRIQVMGLIMYRVSVPVSSIQGPFVITLPSDRP
jgi:hypothetical protein